MLSMTGSASAMEMAGGGSSSSRMVARTSLSRFSVGPMKRTGLLASSPMSRRMMNCLLGASSSLSAVRTLMAVIVS